MDKITKEDFNKLSLHGKGSSSTVYNSIFKLKVDEALIIYKTEWYVKYHPSLIIKRIEKKYGFKYEFGSLADRSGWAVMRIK